MEALTAGSGRPMPSPSDLPDPAVRLSELHRAADNFDQISSRAREALPTS
jgi:hypothetical protein